MKRGVNKGLLAVGALTGVTVLTGAVLCGQRTGAVGENSFVDNLTFSLPVSCTMSGIIETGDEHTLSLVSGQHQADIGKTTITTFCNDSGGIDIYAVGASGNTEGNTDLVSSLGASANIHTGVWNSGSTVSSWAMKLSVVSGDYEPTPVEGKFGNYMDVPSGWTRVAYRDATAGSISMDPETGGSSFETTYEVYANSIQPAGTYNGQVKYVMLHPYDSSRSNLVTLQMALYNALGEPTTTVDGSTTGTKYYRMQDMTTAICDAVTVIGGGSQMQLVDDRPDNNGIRKLYWATKLDDGNCWMTQNLDLDLVAGTTFTHATTDLGWTNLDTEASWTVGNDYSTIPWDPVAGKFTGWSSQNALPYSADPGEKYYYTSGTTSNDTTFSSMSECLAAHHTQADCEHYHAGNYYNWTAAVANNVTNSGNAPDSICPAGWRLPKTSENEFANLLVKYNVISDVSSTTYITDSSNVKIGFNNIRNYPLYFVRSGYVNGGTLNYTTSHGLYWSSTVYSANTARNLNFYDSSVNPAYYDRRYDGWSVRCMAR